jgi:hypothetical protein
MPRPLLWLAFILASIAAQFFHAPPDYFPEDNWPFPVFPVDETTKAIGLAVGIFGLLLLPKILIALDAAASGRAAGFGGGARAFASTFSELLMSSVMAPIILMYQTRSVFQVLPVALANDPCALRYFVVFAGQPKRSDDRSVRGATPRRSCGRHVEILSAWLGDEGLAPDPARRP